MSALQCGRPSDSLTVLGGTVVRIPLAPSLLDYWKNVLDYEEFVK